MRDNYHDDLGEGLSFVLDVWGRHCQEGDFVFVSRKGPDGKWSDFPFKYDPELRQKLESWLKTNPPEEYDLYWCPLPFKKPRRKKEHVKGSALLWSDMDETNPGGLQDKPSVCWESSPGRYQGLWFLNKFLNPKEAEALNKALTYHIGADKGGWDLTQVLRIPGTINHKYHSLPKVRLVRSTDIIYQVDQLKWKTPQATPSNEPATIKEPSSITGKEVLAKYGKQIPRKVLKLLLADSATIGKRSDVIWYLEHKLHEIGLSPVEIIALIKDSVWNKYRGRSDEDTRLTTELMKIIEEDVKDAGHVEPIKSQEELSSSLGLVVESYDEVMANISSYPGWLIEGFWTRRSHGIVAGEPKSFKSTLVLDLALSVASGKPFLGMFPVKEKGPVLFIQNENADWIMRDRMEKIIAHKKLGGSVEQVNERELVVTFPQNLPLFFVNQQGFVLSDPIHQKVLEKALQELKPILVILDPLYLMFDGDINSAKDLNPVLNWLLELKNKYNTGILLVHHWNKGGMSSRGGQRMLGSTTLHGWVESAWYIAVKGESTTEKEVEPDAVSKVSESPVSVVIEREFRAAGTYPKIDLTLKLGEFGDPLYEVEVETHQSGGRKAVSEIKNQIIETLRMKTEPISARRLAEEVGIGRRAVKYALDALSREGKVRVSKEGVVLNED